MQLTKVERLILFNQYQILEKLDPAEYGKHCKEMCEILENGYTLDYQDLFANIYDEVSQEICREVRDVLDMYRALKKAYTKLPEGTVTAADVAFHGFDGNEESKHFAYATFLIETQGKWEESQGDPINSHWPMLGRYRRMLESWKESPNKWDLTVEDVKRIVSQKS